MKIWLWANLSCLCLSLCISLCFIARSPVYSHISLTLQGLSTIHSYSMENEALKQFQNYQNQHTQAFYLNIVLARWAPLCSSIIYTICIQWKCSLTMIQYWFQDFESLCCRMLSRITLSTIELILNYKIMTLEKCYFLWPMGSNYI